MADKPVLRLGNASDQVMVDGSVRALTVPGVQLFRVRLARGHGAQLDLGPGRYFYLFHLTTDYEGKFSVAIDNADILGSGDYDTSTDGDYGLQFVFEVKGRAGGE